jgi:signal transduction histidine kinase
LLISNNTIQLTAFINNLLTTASIEAAKAEPYYELFDLAALAQEVVDLFQASAENKGLTLKLETVPSLSMVSDVTMMRQIITNLVSNAIKYTERGSAVLSLSEVGDIFIISMNDTGIGIDPQHHEMIFDKFFRVRQPKGFGIQQGSGLGLAIVKGLVETLKGSVSVESELGKGSTFTLRLPRHTLADNDLKGPEA